MKYFYIYIYINEMESTKNQQDKLNIGICCFCGFECNPLSQSCGSCARGISCVALGIPVPSHIRDFVYNNYQNFDKNKIKDIKTDPK